LDSFLIKIVIIVEYIFYIVKVKIPVRPLNDGLEILMVEGILSSKTLDLYKKIQIDPEDLWRPIQ